MKNRKFRVQIQRAASDELDRIYDFIYEDSPRRARLFLSALNRKILSLRRFPYRGRRVLILDLEEGAAGVRFLEHHGYLILYIIEGTKVTILHVIRPGQDWIKLFL